MINVNYGFKSISFEGKSSSRGRVRKAQQSPVPHQQRDNYDKAPAKTPGANPAIEAFKMEVASSIIEGKPTKDLISHKFDEEMGEFKNVAYRAAEEKASERNVPNVASFFRNA